jgi:translocation and assembly module TamB
VKRLIATVVAALLLLSVGAALLLIATPSGTRWLIDRALARPAIVAHLQAVDGTLLAGVTIGRAHLQLAGSSLDIEALEFVPAWRASFSHGSLIVKRLAARSLTVASNAVQPQTREPLEFVLPALPLRLEIEDLQLGRLVLEQFPLEYVPALNGQLAFDGTTYVLRSFAIHADAYELHGDVTITSQSDLAVSGSVVWQLNEPKSAGSGELAGSLRDLQLIVDQIQPFAAHAHGRVRLLGEVDPVFDIAVEVPEWAGDQYRLTELTASAAGTLQQFVARGRTNVHLQDAESFVADAAVSGSLDALDVTALSVDSPHGGARATGRIERIPQPRMDLAVDVDNFDPSAIRSKLSGALSGHVDIAWSEQQLRLAIVSLDGTLNGAPFSAAGTLTDSDGVWVTEGLDVRSGPNHANVVMRWDGEKVDAHGTLAMPDLGTLIPDLDGDLNATFLVAGTLASPLIKAQAQSHSLTYGDWSLGDGRLDIDVDQRATGRARLSVATVQGHGSTVTDVLVDAHGSRANAEGTIGWTFAEQRGRVALSARVVGDKWDLVVAEGAALTLPGELWRLDRRITGSAGRNRLTLSTHCWLRGEGAGRVCIDTTEWLGDEIRLAGQVHELPIGELNSFVADLPELAGTASGKWNVAAERRRWHGTAALETVGLSVVDRSDATAVHLIELPQLTLAAALEGNRTTLTLQAVRDGARVLDFNLAIDGFDAAAQLRGHADVQFDDVSGLATLTRRIGSLEGGLRGGLDIGGTIGSPAVSGNIAMRDGHLVLQDPHVDLASLDLTVTMPDLSQLAVRGAAKSKDGSINIDGVLQAPFDARRHFVGHVDASRVAVDIPDADVQVNGRLDLEWTQGLASVKGTIEIPRAQITINKLPEGAVAVSNDVIVVDRVERTSGATRLQVDLELILEDKVHFKAYGLDTYLDGRLRLRQSTDGLVQLNGTVALANGTFTAYGQTLTIESGRLTYSGPPDNPFVDARATRTIKGVGPDIVVGAHVQGPAKNIQTTLFSVPEMSEAQTLAYLVLGRPLSGANAEQTNNVMGAAIALGLGGASPVINEIRNAVGIDELTATGGSTEDLALVVGKRLNQRVFVRYQYQTFTRTGAVLIELLLSRRLSLQATAGQIPAIDVIYRVGEYN